MTSNFLDDMRRSKLPASVVISGQIGGTSTILRGFMKNRLRLSGGNTFSNPLESQALNQADASLQGGLALVRNVAGKFGQEGPSAFSLRNREQTVHVWSGSERPVINLELLFVSLDDADTIEDSPTQKVKALNKAVFPEFSGIGLIPPLGYTTGQSALDSSGTIALSIGTWFRAVGLVIRSVEYELSKEIMPSGRPLFAECNVVLEPYRVVSATEVNDWIIK